MYSYGPITKVFQPYGISWLGASSGAVIRKAPKPPTVAAAPRGLHARAGHAGTAKEQRLQLCQPGQLYLKNAAVALLA